MSNGNGNGNGNGRHIVASITSNALIAEAWKFLAWILIFLWFASAVNSRISRNEQRSSAVESGTKHNRRAIARIEKELKLPPLDLEK